MILKKGNVFDSGADYIGITTNSIVKKNGELVMGAGVALKAKQLYEKLPKYWGLLVENGVGSGSFYGVFPPNSTVAKGIFAFQTKRHWLDDSNIDDVVESAKILKEIALNHPTKVFALAFPAINNGGLDRDFVLSHLEGVGLPDNVHIYEWVK